MPSLKLLATNAYAVYQNKEDDRYLTNVNNLLSGVSSALSYALNKDVDLTVRSIKAPKLKALFSPSPDAESKEEPTENQIADNILALQKEKFNENSTLKIIVNTLALCADIEAKRITSEEASALMKTFLGNYKEKFSNVIDHYLFSDSVRDFMFEKLAAEKNVRQSALETEIEKLKEAINIEENALESVSAFKDSKIDGLEEEIQKLEQELQNSLSHGVKLNFAYTESYIENEQHKRELARTKTELNDTNMALATANESNVEMEGRIEKAKKHYSSLKQDYQNLDGKLSDKTIRHNEEIVALTKRLEDERFGHEQTKLLLQTTQNTLKTAQNDNVRLKTEKRHPRFFDKKTSTLISQNINHANQTGATYLASRKMK